MDGKPHISETIDRFIAAVPVNDHRVITIYWREHAGRRFVRWRYWHKHQSKGCWYPDTRRAFVVPLDSAESLGKAIIAAAKGEPITEKPAWLADADRRRNEKVEILRELNAPPTVIERQERANKRAYGEKDRRPRRCKSKIAANSPAK